MAGTGHRIARDYVAVCVEECLALLLGQDKTDQPDRVHPIIRDLAIDSTGQPGEGRK